MKLSFKHLLPLVAAIAFTTNSARAGLLGDTVNFSSTGLATFTGSATVSNGIEFDVNNNPTDGTNGFFFPNEFLDLGDTTISLGFTAPLQQTITISGIDGILNGATSNSGTISGIQFTSSSITFTYIAGDDTDPNTGLINLTFRETEPPPPGDVPEPATFAALASGLGVIAYIRRNKR
jgi:hypothetical protein